MIESTFLILIEILFISIVILFFYNLKRYFGLSILYIIIGSNQYLQTILATTLYIPISDEIVFSPGSAVLFGSSIFAVLLIYLKEDVSKTRTLIYGIVLANITLTILGASLLWFGWFGFNAGSALTSGGLASIALANTNIAAAAGGFGLRQRLHVAHTDAGAAGEARARHNTTLAPGRSRCPLA